MKLKYKFVVRKVNDCAVAIAVGEDSVNFNGIVKLNPTGEFVFNILSSGDTSVEEIVEKIVEKYGYLLYNRKMRDFHKVKEDNIR